MEALKLKISDYLSSESHIHLGVLFKANGNGENRKKKIERFAQL